MSLEGGKVLCLANDGTVEKILHPTEKIFTIGYYMSCDVIHEHPEVKGIHCAIASDSFGRITVKNYCNTHPIVVNGEAVVGTRPLLTGSTIEIVGKQFRWEYESPKKEEHINQTTPETKGAKVQQAPTSEPSTNVYRNVQKRLTIHSFAYGLNSNLQEDTENSRPCTIIQPLQKERNKENESTANLINISHIDKENCTPKRRMSICSQSDIVVTSYSPRTPGVKTPKGFAIVTPIKKTPKSLYSTPRSALSEYNASQDSKDFNTPMANSPSMCLIDLTTPLKFSKTPIKKTPLLKSALKNSVKSSTKSTLKKTTFSGISGLNLQGRRIALVTPAKEKSVSVTSQNLQSITGEKDSLLESIVEQYSVDSSSIINVDSVSVTEDSSVIEISSDSTPKRLKERIQSKTPELQSRKPIITSARKVKTAEKDFAKKIRNNIGQISENLPHISNIVNIKSRRSSLPATSFTKEKQTLLSQSNTGKLLKTVTTPQRILTTSTPLRSRKSLSTVIQSTPLKTPQRVSLTASFKRHSCINSNQMTPKSIGKTPTKSIMKTMGTKISKNINNSVQFADKLEKYSNDAQENEADALNATFTLDDDDEETKKDNVEELKATEEIGINEISDDPTSKKSNSSPPKILTSNSDLSKSFGEEGVQDSEISSTPVILGKIRKSASFTIETPKDKSLITHSMQKQNECTPIEALTDSEGLMELLRNPRSLNNTPIFMGVKEMLRTPKIESSGNKGDSAIKKLMKTPLKTPKVIGVKQLFYTPKISKEENLVGVKELMKTPKIAKSTEDSFLGVKEIMKTPNISKFMKTEENVSSSQNEGITEQTSEVSEPPNSEEIASSSEGTDEPINTTITIEICSNNDQNEEDSDGPLNAIKTIEHCTNDDQSEQETDEPMNTTKTIEYSTSDNQNEQRTDKPLNPIENSQNSELDDILISQEEQSKSMRRRSASFTIKTFKEEQFSETPCAKDKNELSDLLLNTEPLDDEISQNLNIVNNSIENSEKTTEKFENWTPLETETLKTANTPTTLGCNVEILQKEEVQKLSLELENNTDIENCEHLEISDLPLKIRTPIKDQILATIGDDGKNVNSKIKKNLENSSNFTPERKQIQKSTILKLKTPQKIQSPKLSLALEDNINVESRKSPENSDVSLKIESPKKDQIPVTSRDDAEIQENLENPSIAALKPEHIQRSTRRSTILKTPQKIRTPKISLALEDNVNVEDRESPEITDLDLKMKTPQKKETIAMFYNSEIQENIEYPSTPIPEIEQVQRSTRRSQISNTKTPQKMHTSKLSSALESCESLKTPKKDQTTLEFDKEIVNSEIRENQNTPKPELQQIQRASRRSTIYRIKTPQKMQTPKLLNNSDNVNIENNEISLNSDLPSTPLGIYKPIQRKHRRSTIFNTNTPNKAQSSDISVSLDDNAKIQSNIIPENSNILKTPESVVKPDQKRLTRSALSKLNTPKNNVQTSENIVTRSMRKQLFENKSIESKKSLSLSRPGIKTPKNPQRSSLMVNQNNTADEIVGENKTGCRRHTVGPLAKILHGINDPNSKISEDKDNSSISPKKIDQTKQIEPGKLIKSATFIIESSKQENNTENSNICSEQKSFTESETVDMSNQNLAEELVKSPNNLEDTKESIETSLQTAESLGVKELMQTSKIMKDIEDNSLNTNELLKTPKGLDLEDKICEDTPNKYLISDETSELEDYETLLIDNDSCCSTPTIISVEDQQVEQKSCLKTPTINLKNTPNKSRKSVDFFIESKKQVNTLEIMPECELGETSKHERSIEEFSKTPNYVGMKELLKTPKSEKTGNLIEVKELMKTPANTSKPVRIKDIFNSPKLEKEENLVGLKELLNEPKDLDKTTVFVGIKELLNTPKDESIDELRELGLKVLMKTPAKTPKPIRIKDMFHTPKAEKDVNFVGVKDLMNEPKNLDQTVVLLGIKELVNTPKTETTEEIREYGLKNLMKSPAKTPKPVRVKELFYTPKPEKEDNFVGVKELMNTPKNLDQTTVFVGVRDLLKTPKSDTSDVIVGGLGIKELVKTPLKTPKTPKLFGIKEIFHSPVTDKEARLGGIKELMKTPEHSKGVEINLVGVKELVKTPKNTTNTEDLLGVPEMFSTPHRSDLRNKNDVEDLMKIPIDEFQDEEISQSSLSLKKLSPEKEDLAFKTPSAKMLMVLGTPQSVNIHTEKSIDSSGPPPIYDLKENMDDIEEVFPAAVLNVEEQEESEEDIFDKLIGRSSIRKTYGRRTTPQKNSSLIEQNEEGHYTTDVSQADVSIEKLNISINSEEMEENSRDVGDNATVLSMSGIKVLEKDGDETEDILNSFQDEHIRENRNVQKDLSPVKISSPKTMEKETDPEQKNTPKKTGQEEEHFEENIEAKMGSEFEKKSEIQEYFVPAKIVSSKKKVETSLEKKKTPNAEEVIEDEVETDFERKTEIQGDNIPTRISSPTKMGIKTSSEKKNTPTKIGGIGGIGRNIEEDFENEDQSDLIKTTKVEEDFISAKISSPKKLETEKSSEKKKTQKKIGRRGRNAKTNIENDNEDTTETKMEETHKTSDVDFKAHRSELDVNEIKEIENDLEVAIPSNERETTVNTRTRRGRSKKVESPQKQEVKQTRTRRARKNNDILIEENATSEDPTNDNEESPKNIATSKEVEKSIAIDSIKIPSPKKFMEEEITDEIKSSAEELKKNVHTEVYKDKNEIDKQLTEMNEQNFEILESIPEVKATRRGTRKRKVSNKDAEKEEASNEDPEKNVLSTPLTKRVTRNKGIMKTQTENDHQGESTDEDHSKKSAKVPQKDTREKHVRIVEVSTSLITHEEKDYKISEPAENEEDVSETLPANADLAKDMEKNRDHSSDEIKESQARTVSTRRRGQRNASKELTHTKSSPVQKRKSDSETEEEVVPRKRTVRKRGSKEEEKSDQPNLKIETESNNRVRERRTRRKADNIQDEKQENLSEEPKISGGENLNFSKEPVSSDEDVKKNEIESNLNNADDTEIKIEITSPRRGRAKRKAENNLNITHEDSTVETDTEFVSTRRGRTRRKVDNAVEAPQENEILEPKIETTPRKRGRPKRKVEDSVELTNEPKAEHSPPQRGRPRRKVNSDLKEPKEDRTPSRQRNPKDMSNNLLNMSADELTPIKPANLKNSIEDKENVSTPKNPNNLNALEFKTPMSAAPRARRALRSNSTILTPVLMEQNSEQQIIVIDNSLDKIESSLPEIITTRTRGRKRINSMKEEIMNINANVEQLETSINDPPVKSGRTAGRGRARINSTKEDISIVDISETPEIAIPTATRTRGRTRINSTKEDVQILSDTEEPQPEISTRGRGRKKVNSTKEEVKGVDVETEQSEISEIATAAASGKTRGRKKIDSTKEDTKSLEIEDQVKESENVPLATKSVRTRGRARINSTRDDLKIIAETAVEQSQISEKTSITTTSSRTRGRGKINSTKEEVQILEVNVEQSEASEKTNVTTEKKRGRRNANSAKEDIQIVDDDVEELEVFEEASATTTSGRTRGRRNINSAKEDIKISESNEEKNTENDVNTRTRTTRRKKTS